jgi:hypothetical protein
LIADFTHAHLLPQACHQDFRQGAVFRKEARLGEIKGLCQPYLLTIIGKHAVKVVELPPIDEDAFDRVARV